MALAFAAVRDHVKLLFVGSYTSERGGRGAGISTVALDPTSKDMHVRHELALASPSYLALHPALPVLYAASETDRGHATALAIDSDGALRTIGEADTAGAGPCHLTLTPDARHLLCSNYVSGSLAVFRLDDSGAIAEGTDLVVHDGRGPDPERQEGPHIHMAVVEPDGVTVQVVDLGTDEIRTYRLEDDGRLSLLLTTALPPGSGPRQLLRLPTTSGTAVRYVVACELSSGIALLEADPNRPDQGLRLLMTRPATAGHVPDGVRNYPSHLALSPDGHTIFLSNRGVDCISAFVVSGESLVAVADYPTHGRWPRHFGVDGASVFVASQDDDRVVLLEVDPTGGLADTGRRVAVGSPTCVVMRSLD